MMSVAGMTAKLSAMKKGLAASFTINFSSDPKFKQRGETLTPNSLPRKPCARKNKMSFSSYESDIL
ncbi:MAG: hypothetical protein ACTH58_17415 [Marinomonas foliarum]|uniref:hypothetical protein n=1 Tax=Marinomonas foliarum TaxID=491950 RepID=UPI003F95AF4B